MAKRPTTVCSKFDFFKYEKFAKFKVLKKEDILI